MPAQFDEEELADWRAGRNAVYQLAALTIGEKGREPPLFAVRRLRFRCGWIRRAATTSNGAVSKRVVPLYGTEGEGSAGRARVRFCLWGKHDLFRTGGLVADIGMGFAEFGKLLFR
jgi:hypothetical protein